MRHDPAGAGGSRCNEQNDYVEKNFKRIRRAKQMQMKSMLLHFYREKNLRRHQMGEENGLNKMAFRLRVKGTKG